MKRLKTQKDFFFLPEIRNLSKKVCLVEAYLRLTNLRLALVINFGERLVKDGIHRVVNGL